MIRNVLGLFDGISCGQLALHEAGINYDNYYASEIDKNCIKITQKNFPNTQQVGDIENWKSWDLENIDLIIGGSPCQGFSTAGKMLNFDDPRSKLFFEFLAIVKHYQPKYFLLENVVMKPEIQDAISLALGVEPIFIDSQKVSAQMRKRLYWTNIPDIDQPKDLNIKLKDILEKDIDWMPAHIVGRRLNAAGVRKDYDKSLPITQCIQVKKNPDKTQCLTTVSKDAIISSLPHGRYPDAYGKFRGDWRNLTNIECERLQTLPDGYTEGIAETQRRRAIGNGWTVKVIAHIFSHME
jgi:DNA (cytosine-5)-methyltransferase 3A|tara:strand:+ start:959 stop:1843 length:885 start_codon:yes stop_codon:yes gene_type:complete